MSKIEVNRVAEILKKNEIPPAVLRRVIEEMNLAVQPDPGNGDIKPPALKKQWCVVVSDPEGLLPKTDLVAWVLQIPESESVATTQDRINRGAYDFNASKKGQHMGPVKTVGEAIENVPAKFFKQAELWVKTRSPVMVSVLKQLEIPKG